MLDRMKQLPWKKMAALFAVVVAVFLTVQLPGFAGTIDMGCNASKDGVTIQANDREGMTWKNPCAKPVTFTVTVNSGTWNFGPSGPFSTMVSADGNPAYPPPNPYYADPNARRAELVYLVNGSPACGYLDGGNIILPPNGSITLVNNDATGFGCPGDRNGNCYLDNQGSLNVSVSNQT